VEQGKHIADRIIDAVIQTTNCTSDDLIGMYERRVQAVLDYSHLPIRYYIEYIDTTGGAVKSLSNLTHMMSTVPTNMTKLNILKNDIIHIIDNNLSSVVWLPNFKESGYIASYLIEQYTIDRLAKDEHIHTMLYIDTNLFMEDCKKLMDRNIRNQDTVLPRPNYDFETLYREIYDADFIFWDKFNLADTNYETAKLYEILSVRYGNKLGNVFFMKGNNASDLYANFNEEIMNVMDVTNIYDFRNEVYKHI
jgi:hypothetical protein